VKTAETIKNNVEQELRWEPSVCATKIGVSVNNGVVELDGHVGSLYEKWAAERAAMIAAPAASSPCPAIHCPRDQKSPSPKSTRTF